MRLYEYEGKELFREVDISTAPGTTAIDVEEAVQAASQLGYPVVIKAQVLRGGRGKAGLIRIVETEKALREAAQQLFTEIKQDELLLIEKIITADIEAYMGITIDDLAGMPVLAISSRGGIHVEELSVDPRHTVITHHIHPEKGIYQYQVLDMAKRVGFHGAVAVKFAKLACKLYRLFQQFDCETAEINPVMINSKTNDLIAGDSKIIVDEYSFDRQPKLAEYRRRRKLNDSGIFFVDLGGNIGIVSGGASGTMLLCDSIKAMGGEPANFIDGVGGSTAESVAEKSRIVLSEAAVNDRYRVLLFNFNLTATSLKAIVEGVVRAVKDIPPKVPVVASIRASGAAVNDMSFGDAREILRTHGVVLSPSLEEAIKSAIEISRA